jgi:hypothetical protein
MATKELPFFKFNPSRWMLGRISDENFRVQGIFIRACCIYWLLKNNKTSSSFDVNLVEFSKKLGKTHVTLLQNLGYIILSGNHLTIPFLDEEFNEALNSHLVNSKNGKKGAEARLKPGISQAQAPLKHLDIEKEEDTDKEIEGDIPDGTITENLNFLFESQRWKDDVCKNQNLTPDQLTILLAAFKAKVITGSEHRTVGGYKQYFANWLPLNRERFLKATIEIPKTDTGQIDYTKVNYDK